jgi:VWFA-related protein
VITAVLLSGLAPALAQAPSFRSTVQVNVVNIEVFVSDAEGRPVVGLTPDDFEVFENGLPVRIANFYAVNPQQNQTAMVEAAEEEEVRLEQSLHLVILIDSFNTHQFNRNRMIKQLLEFVQEIPDKDIYVMVASMDGALKIHQEFTDDMSTVVDALRAIQKSAGMVRREIAYRHIINEINDAREAAEALMYARNQAVEWREELIRSIGAIEDTIAFLAGLPGRRAVIHVSDGFSPRPGEELFDIVAKRHNYPEARLESVTFEQTDRVQSLVSYANANSVTFYTVDAGGVRGSIANSLELPELASTTFDFITTTNLRAPLEDLAAGTGGHLIWNTNNVLPELNKAAADFETYYSLGYDPTNPEDTTEREIVVRVRREDVTVRHRRTFRVMSPEEEMNDLTTAALQQTRIENSLGLTVEVEPPPHELKGRHLLVPVRLRIPLTDIVMVPDGTGFRGELLISAAAADSGGGLSDVFHERLPVTIPAQSLEQALASSVTYEATLVLRRGAQKIVFTVKDVVTGEGSAIRTEIVADDS